MISWDCPSIIAIENGKLVAKKEGKATITFSGKNGEVNVNKQIEVEVLPVPQSLSVVVGSDNTINEGRDQKIVVTVTYSDGKTEQLTKDITYTVSDSEIIAQKGSTNYLAGKKAGKATLTASVNIDGFALEASVEVTVKGEEPVVSPTTAKPADEPAEPVKKGCKSSITLTIVAPILAVAACGIMVIKRRKED